jgi:NTE family protein
MSEKPRIALVIGWGSVKCAAALGLYRVLRAAGIELDLLVTSGGGSIFGALMALGHSADEIIETNRRLWTSEVTEKANRGAILQLVLPKLFKPAHYFNLKDDALVNERLRAAFEDRSFSETEIPLRIVATNYRDGEEAVFSEGSIYQAVRASIALPLVFPPVEQDGQLLADGYLSEPLPVGVAIQEGADIIIAMGFGSVSREPRRSMSDYLLHLSSLMSKNLLEASTAFYSQAHHSELIPIVLEFGEEVHMFDTHRVPEIIRLGEEEGHKLLPRLRSLLELSQ